MATPDITLENSLRHARDRIDQPLVRDQVILDRITYVSRCLSNRSGARMLMSCALAKITYPHVDIRKPYTEIRTPDSFSGRVEFDEKYIWPFAAKYQLPLNSTTAFLTPGFRTINTPLAPPLVITGRPRRMYVDTIQLLDDVFHNRITAEQLLGETIRQLLLLQQEQQGRMEQLLAELATTGSSVPLAVEEIVSLIEQHLGSPKSSRLPVLVVAAAYRTVSHLIGEKFRALQSHNAADLQTGALGDIEITLADEEEVVTSYEMKDREVTKLDMDIAVRKLANAGRRVDNYVFITTFPIDKDVAQYAASLYRETGGIEFAILDCLGFLRHFLHLFHRLRSDYLESYQALVISQPDSAVSQPLKELFLVLRRAMEIDSDVQ